LHLGDHGARRRGHRRLGQRDVDLVQRRLGVHERSVLVLGRGKEGRSLLRGDVRIELHTLEVR